MRLLPRRFTVQAKEPATKARKSILWPSIPTKKARVAAAAQDKPKRPRRQNALLLRRPSDRNPRRSSKWSRRTFAVGRECLPARGRLVTVAGGPAHQHQCTSTIAPAPMQVPWLALGTSRAVAATWSHRLRAASWRKGSHSGLWIQRSRFKSARGLDSLGAFLNARHAAYDAAIAPPMDVAHACKRRPTRFEPQVKRPA